MAVDRGRRGGLAGGISLGGILVIVGIIVAIVWSLWLGIIIALVGLLPFGGLRGESGISDNAKSGRNRPQNVRIGEGAKTA